ncbi:LCP family glycopolymer transferase [Timonella sp. A28]|uniref:LCP family protein n=1 Tax=Timonella sp. A28 TaxID=3442640 RepID=UPI003EBE126E
MSEHNGTPRNNNGRPLPPPSFTPAAGRPQRPRRTPAIEVGSPDTGPQQTRAFPAQTSQDRQPATNSQPVVQPRRTPPAHSQQQGQAPQQRSQAPSYAPGQPTHGTEAPRRAPQQPHNGPVRHVTHNRPPQQPVSAPPKRKSRKRLVGVVALLVVVALLAWPVGILIWANSKINHIEALSGAPNTPGTTYLIAGSDSRKDTDIGGDVAGARADTIMLLHVPKSGPTALISLPRDIYVPIPGHDSSKINAAFSWGGAPLLVETVEDLTGMTVDHYVEVGFEGVEGIVDAVGGVELCLDQDVNDKQSELVWESGCHEADGHTALAFARMRKADPLGDIGRAERQRQVISAVAAKLQSPTQLLSPTTQVNLINAGTHALVVSEGTGFIDLGRLALAFRSANSEQGVTGTPPIVSLNYRPGGVGAAVQLDEEATPVFFTDIAEGNLEPGEYNGLK